MTALKSYTDIEQSKKLTEILPIETADMVYRILPGVKDNMPNQYIAVVPDIPAFASDIPCWSLAALLGVIPYPTLHRTISGWRCDMYNEKGYISQFGEDSDNPIDACYNLILKLHELNLL